ncbi:MAG TPA: YceI family protein [Steroidobacteraceae bacterium]|nr:YceI family protein [Steroidobacteraceae bacterium]
MKSSKLAILLALLAGAVTPVLAAPMTYSFDPNHSFVRFGYGHFGFSHQQSRFDKVTGSVIYDAAAKTGSADVTIDIHSVDSGSTLFNGHLQSPMWFDAAKFPTATFKSTKLRFRGDTPVALEGDLTIKGVTHPITLKITNFKVGELMKRQHLGADATAIIKRSDYGLGNLAPMVDDNVVLTVNFEANAGPPPTAG